MPCVPTIYTRTSHRAVDRSSALVVVHLNVNIVTDRHHAKECVRMHACLGLVSATCIVWQTRLRAQSLSHLLHCLRNLDAPSQKNAAAQSVAAMTVTKTTARAQRLRTRHRQRMCLLRKTETARLSSTLTHFTKRGALCDHGSPWCHDRLAQEFDPRKGVAGLGDAHDDLILL